MKRMAIITAGCLLALCMTACTNWERSVYQTLSASQAVINQAQIDYEVSATTGTCPAIATTPCLPHTKAVYDTINTAKNTQTTTVNSFLTYEEAKAAGGTAANLTALQADVTVALNNLPTIIANVKALYQGVK